MAEGEVGVEEGGVVEPVVAGEDVAVVAVVAAAAAFAAAVAFAESVGLAFVEVFAVVPKMHQHRDEIGLVVLAMPQRLRSLEAVVWAVAQIGHVPGQESGEIAGNFGRP